MNQIQVLDHGFVRLLNLSGPFRRPEAAFDASDVDPALTARITTKTESSPERDLKLCSYLMKNQHTTPIEMIEVWLEMKLPIFVARQFIRHRTSTVNEMSARYVELPAEWYVPKPENVGWRQPGVKQGRTLAWEELSNEQQKQINLFCSMLKTTCADSYKNYEVALKVGIPPELARCFLHLNHYTHWIWKQNLHNIMHALSLRDHSHAQWEAQEYARGIDRLLRGQLPGLMELYDEFRRKKD